MAPILSLTKECLDSIKEDVSLAVVSIWEVDDASGSKTSFRSGFVFFHVNRKCVILTLSKDLDVTKRRRIFVRFENGQAFEGFVTFGDNKANLAAITVDGLKFEPKNVSFSRDEAKQCDTVLHMGCFDEENAKFNFSSGSVGLVGHNNTHICNETFTRFSHSCSQKLHMLGAPVFNLRGEIVGVNYSQMEDKNLFFAMDLEQLKREVAKLDIKGRMAHILKELKQHQVDALMTLCHAAA